MARMSKRLADLHAKALQQFEDSYNATSTDRQKAIASRRFVNIAGAQWDWDEKDEFKNKAKFELDHVSGAVQRIKNEYRKNRISAKFLPKDGTESDALADACASRFRADTQDASGREARDLAFDCSVEGGFAGVRVRAEVEKGEQQRICLEPIYDAEISLFFDVNAKKKDKSDAYHAFYVEPWSEAAFKEEFKGEPVDWPDHLKGRFKFEWFGATVNKMVMVAEYFVKEDFTQTYHVFEGYNDTQEVLEDDLDEAKLAELEATGYVETGTRDEEIHRVAKYVLNGAKVLKGPETIPGTEIPLIPQYGQRTVIERVERFKGHVTKAMDGQIIYNLLVSKVGEDATISSAGKPIFLAEQIARHSQLWHDDQTENYPYLTVDPVYDQDGKLLPTGPIGYTQPPEVPPAVAALIQLTKQDISDMMGNPQNAETVEPDVSGVALDLIQGRIDMQAYGYLDNAADTERRIAEVWQSMASVVYDAKNDSNKGRKLKTLSEDGKRGTVEIGKQVLDSKTGKQIAEIDFSRAAFDIEVDVGPTSASRRSAIVRTVSGLMGQTTDPEVTTVLTHVALMNLEAEGMQDVRDYSRKKLLAMGVVKPTKEEQAEMEQAAAAAQGQQQPDPNLIMASAMAEEALAKAEKARADTGKAAADTELAKAKTAETLAGIPIAQHESAVRTAKEIFAAEGQADAGPAGQ